MELQDLKKLFDETTDNYFVCDILCDGQWHTSMDIMKLKDNPARGFVCRNFAVRSRISNIKDKVYHFGWTVESEKEDRSNCHKYRLAKIEQLEMAIA